MGIDLDSKLVQTCSLVTTSHNGYGDIEYSTTATLDCLFRDISSLTIANANREAVQIDGIFWFKADSTVSRGDIILFNSEYYRVDRITKARRLVADDTFQFVRAEVMRQRQVS